MTPKTYQSFLQTNISNLQKDHGNDEKINSLDKNTEIQSEERDKVNADGKITKDCESQYDMEQDPVTSLTHTPKTVQKSPNMSPTRESAAENQNLYNLKDESTKKYVTVYSQAGDLQDSARLSSDE